jgi:DNA polymerase-1
MWRLSSDSASAPVSTTFLQEHAAHLANPHTVVILQDAKPLLRRLLKDGIDVARPACLTTLEKISFQAPEPKENVFDHLDSLLDAVTAQSSKALARLECLAIRPFAHMEAKGLYIDSQRWSLAVAERRKQADEATKACEDFLAPYAQKDLFNNPIINLNNLEEMRSLFEKALGKNIATLSNEVLETLDAPLAQAYLQYREAAKIVSTYGERFLEHVDPKTKRIHAEFHLLSVSTGRTSCTKPNLQNLPSDPKFADCLVAPAGRALIHADFSACELRVLAGLAQDPNFLAAINSDEDFHSTVASSLFGVKVSKTENPHLRQRAKAINFGIIYGMGAKGLARSLDIGDDEAQNILSLYFSQYSRVRDYLEGCVSTAKRLGYARTLLGRRLHFPDAQGEGADISRIAKNMPIQGTAAELAKLAMTRVHERLSQEFKEAYLVNMIHDELVVECRDSDNEAVSEAVKEEMMGAQEALFSQVRPDVEISRQVF